MNRKFIIPLVFLIIIISNISVLATDIRFSYGSLEGHSTYIIEEKNNYKSKLEFPLNVNIINLTIGNENLELKLTTNLDKNAGTFIDTDWFRQKGTEESIYDIKDIYSESQTDLSAYILDSSFNFLTERFKNKNYEVNIGYRYEKFDYMIHDLVQYGSFYDREEIIIRNGNVLDYEVNYHIPYISFNSKDIKINNKLNTNFSILYSPLVNVNDRDDHLLRNKISFIRASGQAFEFKSNLSYYLKKNILLFSNINISNMNTNGIQVQKDYYGNILFEDINSHIKSRQLSFVCGIKILF